MIGDGGRLAWAGEVDQALRMLDRDEQSFIRLSYFGGLDHAGIAESAGVSLAVVCRTMASGMRSLGRDLESRRVGPSAARRAAKDATDGDRTGPELGLGLGLET